MGFLGIGDGRFWIGPLEHQAAIGQELLGEGFRGLLLDAPARVDASQRGRLPVVACQVASVEEFDRADLGREGILSGLDLETGEVLAAPLVDVELGPPQVEPFRRASRAVGATMWLADARRRLGLPWAKRRWLLTLLLREAATNRVLVTLERSTDGPQPPAVAQLIAEERRRRLATWPGLEGLVLDDPEAPAPPTAPGLVLGIERVAELRPGGAVPLRLAFTLPVRPWERLEAPGPGGAQALVAIGLVVTAAGLSAPYAWTLRLPVRVGPDDPLATAQASIDLARLPGFAPQPRRYVAWAFAHEHAAPPAVCTLMSRESILDR